ncbi:MAG: ATP-binding cassette domain-containing protein [Solirubrobacteraceae bacterium]
MSLLAFRQVSKRFTDGMGEIAVLDRVSFEVEVGETVGLLASRRAGKTTLLMVAAGLLAPSEGQVLWDEDTDFGALSPDERARFRRRGGIAFMQEDWRAERGTTVLAHVAVPHYSMGMKMGDAEEHALRTLELLEAGNLAYRSTRELGLPERSIVELARAIVREPRLLLVDEPAVLPRPMDARVFYALLRSLPEKIGCSLLIASEEVTPLGGCRPMMTLSDGHLTSTATRRKVIAFPGGGPQSKQAS